MKGQKKEKNPINNYARYSSIAIQMVAIILIGTFGGIKLDEWTGTKFPAFTVVLSILSAFLSIYWVLKEFLKGKKD